MWLELSNQMEAQDIWSKIDEKALFPVGLSKPQEGQGCSSSLATTGARISNSVRIFLSLISVSLCMLILFFPTSFTHQETWRPQIPCLTPEGRNYNAGLQPRGDERAWSQWRVESIWLFRRRVEILINFRSCLAQ